jgi:hypothetical protein
MVGPHMEVKNAKGRLNPQESRCQKNDGYCAVGDGVAEGGFDWLSPGFGRLIFFN